MFVIRHHNKIQKKNPKQRKSESKCKQKLGCMQMNAKINCHRLCVSCNHVFVCVCVSVCCARLYTQIKSLFRSLTLALLLSQKASHLMTASANYFEHMSEIIFERCRNKKRLMKLIKSFCMSRQHWGFNDTLYQK